MLKLMDCTLRDGANVVGKGFDAEITKIVLDILTKAGVDYIEFGNAGGIGAYEVAGFTNALTDDEYLELVRPYLGKGNQIGMFLNATRHRPGNDVPKAAKAGLDFLRVGCEPGRGEIAVPAIKEMPALAFTLSSGAILGISAALLIVFLVIARVFFWHSDRKFSDILSSTSTAPIQNEEARKEAAN